MPQLVDSHCHLNFDPLGGEIPDVLQRARDSGVGHMLCVSVTLEKFPEIRALARAHPNIFASVGVHPNEQTGHDPTVDELVEFANDDRVVAIGETGLDYFRSSGDMTWQRERFRNHIRAARRANKPLIVHTREAAADTLQVLREEHAAKVGGVMHCFTETWEVAQQALDMNFYISFSGIVTFKNATSLREVARLVPSDRFLVETDSPYLAPIPYRGKTNEPAYVKYVAQCLAEVRGVDVAEITEQSTHNFFALFRTARPALG